MSSQGPEGRAVSQPASGGTVMLPTSFAQELLWLTERASPGQSVYNAPRTRRLIGRLDVEALHGAFDALAARHEILRTTYGFHDDEPVQLIHPAAPVPFDFVDLSTLPDEEREEEVARQVRVRSELPFDLGKEAPLRVAVFRLGDEEHVLHIDSHHIASDGWSRDVMFRDLDVLYSAQAAGSVPELPELPIQYGDFSVWQREQIGGARLDSLLRFWRKHLEGAETVLHLPTDFPRPPLPEREGITRSITLPSDSVEVIRQLGGRHQASLYMTLLAAYGTVLHRYTDQADVLVGSPVAARSLAETEGLIGYFSNTVVQRVRFGSDPTFDELLDQMRESALAVYEQQDVPFEKLVLELQKGQPLTHSPLFQVVFTMLDQSEGGAARLGDLEVRAFGREATATKFDLTLFMADRPEGLTLTLRARADLFAPSSVERFLEHLRGVLDAAVADPSIHVARIPMLTAGESAELASENRTSVQMGPETTLHELFESAVDRAPAATAVVADDVSLTYAELDARANRVARLLRARGVGRGAVVGICLDRSASAVVALVGVLKAGGAFMPVPPELPPSRMEQQLAAGGARLVVTEPVHARRLPQGVDVVYVGGEGPPSDAESGARVDTVSLAGDPAYILFTSGSTGIPKPVSVSHGNIVHYVRAVARVLGDVPATSAGNGLDRLAGWAFASPSSMAADLGNTALFPALCSGGAIHVLSARTATDPAAYGEYMRAHDVDVLKITPRHLEALCAGRPPQEWGALLPRRWLVLGGEALSLELADKLLRAGSCRVLNHYGPTETTVGATTFEVTAGSLRAARASGAQTVPIGRPLANTRLAVVDARGEPVPPGLPGELAIAGPGVSGGYLGQADSTRQRFVELPSLGRSYRTGDRVRRLPMGDLEFLGRMDDQVKVRGYRVEPGEVEHILVGHPGVERACVILREDVGGEPMLIAYAVPRKKGYAAAHGAHVTAEGLSAFVAERLPAYMVPGAVVLLDELPLASNGKLDRGALPQPGLAPAKRVEPRSETEEALVQIWADALKRDPSTIGVTDDFLALGGHSLVAIRILGKLSRAFGVRLPLRALFEAPTVEQLADLVELEIRVAAVEGMSEEEAERMLATDGEQEARG